jgi:hypothetical protein
VSQWLTPVILIIWEAKIGKITDPANMGKKVHETPFQQKEAEYDATYLSSQLLGGSLK